MVAVRCGPAPSSIMTIAARRTRRTAIAMAAAAAAAIRGACADRLGRHRILVAHIDRVLVRGTRRRCSCCRRLRLLLQCPCVRVARLTVAARHKRACRRGARRARAGDKRRADATRRAGNAARTHLAALRPRAGFRTPPIVRSERPMHRRHLRFWIIRWLCVWAVACSIASCRPHQLGRHRWRRMM